MNELSNLNNLTIDVREPEYPPESDRIIRDEWARLAKRRQGDFVRSYSVTAALGLLVWTAVILWILKP